MSGTVTLRGDALGKSASNGGWTPPPQDVEPLLGFPWYHHPAMPHYDYQCNDCHAVFEVEHAMGAKPRVKCPACGSTNTVKQFGAAGVQFKGSGFYVTDSRNSDKKLTSGKDITPKADAGSDTTTATDAASKPESTAKPESAPASKPVKTPEPAAK